MSDKILLNRTATSWNLLRSEIAAADPVSQFKARIYWHMTSGGLENICLQILKSMNIGKQLIIW